MFKLSEHNKGARTEHDKRARLTNELAPTLTTRQISTVWWSEHDKRASAEHKRASSEFDDQADLRCQAG